MFTLKRYWYFLPFSHTFNPFTFVREPLSGSQKKQGLFQEFKFTKNCGGKPSEPFRVFVRRSSIFKQSQHQLCFLDQKLHHDDVSQVRSPRPDKNYTAVLRYVISDGRSRRSQSGHSGNLFVPDLSLQEKEFYRPAY